MKRILLLLVLVVAVSGCTQGQDAQNTLNANTADAGSADTGGLGTNSGTADAGGSGGDGVQAVENGDTIKVEYVGRFPDGEVFDKSEGRGPLEFVVGAGQMIKGFDAAVVGMGLNTEKTVTIPPEDAYGTADSGDRVEVAVEQIGGAGTVEVGSNVQTGTGQQGTVIGISNGMATVEFIHPLAGKTLEFWIKVVGITKG